MARAAKRRRRDEPAWPARADLRVLNHDTRRVDGPAKVTGAARYSHDMRPEGMVFARLRLASLPSAKILSIDVAAAKAMKGVLEAIVLERGERVRFLGQPLAAVAAERPEIAAAAARAIDVKLEAQPWAVTREQALADDAPKVREKGNTSGERERGKPDEAEAAFAGAEAVVEAEYSVPIQHHASLETHGVVVEHHGDGRFTVHASTQGTFTIAGEAAEALGVEPTNVRTNVQYMGGGFGSKFGIGIEGRAACELASLLKRSVHLLVTREDEFLMAGNRSGAVARMKAGVAKDGTIVAFRADVDRLGGLGGGSYPNQPYIYKVAAAYSKSRSVHTHMDANRAMRAPGHPQASFGIESLVDELAYAVGMDLLEFRKKNLADPVYHRQLDRVAKEIGWAEHPNRSKPGSPSAERAIGIGFGVSTWGGGGGPECKVEVRIGRDGSVSSSVGTQDLGTGVRTYVASIPAEILGLPVSAVEARIGSSEYGAANPSGGSTTTASLAPAVLAAAFNARKAFFEKLAPALGGEPALLALEDGELYDRAKPDRRVPWKEACAMLPAEGISAVGEWQESLAGNGIHGAQAAKVEVDTLTGAVRVLKMVCIQDQGLPLNRAALRSQINGGMIQALSYGLFEERVVDPWIGSLLTGSFDAYKLASSCDMPEMVALIDDEDERQVVVGMAEATIIPGHSAIANAVHNACGARIRALPLTPDKVLMELERLRR